MLRVAVVQMISTDKVDDNLESVAVALVKARNIGCHAVVLPENFAFMGQTDKAKLSVAEKPHHGPIQNFLAQQAKIQKLWLIAGTIPIQSSDPQKVLARSLVYNPNGYVVQHYDKIHLFDVSVGSFEHYAESETTLAGQAIALTGIDNQKLGLSVCYDLRFPELYRCLVRAGATMVSVPSAFTKTTGQKHWQSLLRARAIENQVFVLAANQGGRHPGGRETYGHSMIVGPDGDILAEATVGEEILFADLDFSAQNSLRQRFPVFSTVSLYRG